MSSAPILTCSTVSFSEPSAPSAKTLILSRPPVSLVSSSPVLHGQRGRVVLDVDVGRAELARVRGGAGERDRGGEREGTEGAGLALGHRSLRLSSCVVSWKRDGFSAEV
jgi:hypothetical protein